MLHKKRSHRNEKSAFSSERATPLVAAAREPVHSNKEPVHCDEDPVQPKQNKAKQTNPPTNQKTKKLVEFVVKDKKEKTGRDISI